MNLRNSIQIQKQTNFFFSPSHLHSVSHLILALNSSTLTSRDSTARTYLLLNVLSPTIFYVLKNCFIHFFQTANPALAVFLHRYYFLSLLSLLFLQLVYILKAMPKASTIYLLFLTQQCPNCTYPKSMNVTFQIYLLPL